MEITNTQLEFINGNLLGDGGLGCPRSETANSYFYIGQHEKNTKYIKAIEKIYTPFISKCFIAKTAKKPNGDGYFTQIRLRSICNPAFTELRSKWYKEPYESGSCKIVPRDLTLSWLTAAIWACDDGSNIASKRTFKLYTNCFSMSDVEFLAERLKIDLNIGAKIGLERGKPVIGLFGVNGECFINGIKPYIPWECLQYKLLKWKPSLNPNTSGVIGVSKVKNLWQSHIMKHGVRMVKYFDTKEEAIMQRKEWEKCSKIIG